MDTYTVYVEALTDSLTKKLHVINRLLELTKEQESLLKQEESDMDVFDDIMNQKDTLLHEMAELDRGFDTLFERVREELVTKKQQYRSQILQMQNLIRSITDCGVQLEGLEQKNKEAFQQYLLRQRQEIKSFKTSNKTAESYYQNMANQHHEWQTYFVDQKK